MHKNNSELETTLVPIYNKMDKQTIVYSLNGILHWREKIKYRYTQQYGWI